MTEEEIKATAVRIVSAILLGRAPAFSDVVRFVPNHNGHGQSLEDAVAISLEVEDLWSGIVEFWEDSIAHG